jgi:hypothetical protein
MNKKQIKLASASKRNWNALRPFVLLATVGVIAVILGVAIAQENWLLLALILGGGGLLLVLLTQTIRSLFFWWIALGPLLARWGGIELGTGVPNITFNRVMAVFLIILMLKELLGARWTEHLQRFSITLVDFGLGLWCLVYLASGLLRSESVISGLFNVFQIAVLPTMIYYAARFVFHTEEDIRKFMRTLAFVTIYLVAGTLYEQITHTTIIANAGAGMIQAGLMRSGSFLGAPWTLGYVLLLILPLMFYAEDIAQNRLRRHFYRFVILAILLAVFFTYIRAVWIALMLQTLLLVIVFPKWRRLMAFGTIGLAIILFTLWPSLSTSDAITMQLGNPANLLIRAEIAEMQWHRFLERPWLGFGGNQGRVGLEETPAHNTWLVMLVELGLVGTIPLLVAIGSAVLQEVRTVLRAGRLSTISGRWSMVLLISLMPLIIVSNAVDLTYFTFELGLTFVYLALLVGSKRIYGQ